VFVFSFVGAIFYVWSSTCKRGSVRRSICNPRTFRSRNGSTPNNFTLFWSYYMQHFCVNNGPFKCQNHFHRRNSGGHSAGHFS